MILIAATRLQAKLQAASSLVRSVLTRPLQRSQRLLWLLLSLPPRHRHLRHLKSVFEAARCLRRSALLQQRRSHIHAHRRVVRSHPRCRLKRRRRLGPPMRHAQRLGQGTQVRERFGCIGFGADRRTRVLHCRSRTCVRISAVAAASPPPAAAISAACLLGWRRRPLLLATRQSEQRACRQRVPVRVGGRHRAERRGSVLGGRAVVSSRQGEAREVEVGIVVERLDREGAPEETRRLRLVATVRTARRATGRVWAV